MIFSFFSIVAKLKIEKKADGAVFTAQVEERICPDGPPIRGGGGHRPTGGTHSITKLCEVNDFNNVKKAI